MSHKYISTSTKYATNLIFLIIAYVLLCLSNRNTKKENEEKVENINNKMTVELNEMNFKPDKIYKFDTLKVKIGGKAPEIQIDKNLKKIAICSYNDESNYLKIIDFSDIIECSILEDNATVMDGGIGRAIVGGAIAGETGAIVGSNTRKAKNVTNSLILKIVTQNIEEPLIMISFISSEIERSENTYIEIMREVQELHSTLVVILRNNKQDVNQPTDNYINKIEKLFEIKEKGIITEQEYNAQKDKILNSI